MIKCQGECYSKLQAERKGGLVEVEVEVEKEKEKDDRVGRRAGLAQE